MNITLKYTRSSNTVEWWVEFIGRIVKQIESEPELAGFDTEKMRKSLKEKHNYVVLHRQYDEFCSWCKINQHSCTTKQVYKYD